jgi:NADH-quinone oxidoreductase subunit L
MTIATFAIAGFPPLAGFFSKDEILWQAFSSPHGSWVYWLVGVVTAFITSFYMFRLWFMTFFGEYRGASAHHDDHGHGHTHDDGHGHAPHESPMVMLAPLMILAVLSVVGGWVGIGGWFEHFLVPALGSGPEAAAETGNLEWYLMGVSVLAALGGFGLAWQLYYRDKDLPAKIAASLGGLYRAVLNKYYVDEIYGAVLVRPLIVFSRAALWQGADRSVIDAAVNGSATTTREVSDGLRQMQSGNLRSYAGWIAAGSAVVIGYMLWAGVR